MGVVLGHMVHVAQGDTGVLGARRRGIHISRVDRGVIHHEVMLRVDSLGLAALTQVIIWALSTLVPSSDHFTLASIADDSRMLLHGSISRWFVTT